VIFRETPSSARRRRVYRFNRKRRWLQQLLQLLRSCIDALKPPSFTDGRFGFVTKVLLVRRPCSLEVDCHQMEAPLIWRRQTGEAFSSQAPPDCRIELNPDGCQSLL